MNARIQYQTSFTAGVHWQDKLYMTNYTVNLKMITGTMDSDEQNIALMRLKAMVSEEFTNSVFINQTNQKQIKQYLNAGVKCTTLPEEPLDQIIGIMLFCKLNAVMEQRLIVLDLELSSELGDMVLHCHGVDENIGPFADTGWWHDSEPVHNDLGKYYKRMSDERIVEMHKPRTWKDFGFHWDPLEETPLDSTVVYLDFPRKNEN